MRLIKVLSTTRTESGKMEEKCFRRDCRLLRRLEDLRAVIKILHEKINEILIGKGLKHDRRRIITRGFIAIGRKRRYRPQRR